LVLTSSRISGAVTILILALVSMLLDLGGDLFGGAFVQLGFPDEGFLDAGAVPGSPPRWSISSALVRHSCKTAPCPWFLAVHD
jgi:hypothetical protein